MWRVRILYGDEEDALQECAVIFIRCRNKYEGKISNPAWLMSLFKIAVSNDWNSFANRDGRMRQATDEYNQIGGDWHSDTGGMLDQLLRQSSNELLGVIDILLSAPAELIGANATLLNRRITRLLGLPTISNDYKHDYLAEMRDILEPRKE